MKERWLGCIIHEGSNYVLLRGVGGGEVRVHNDEFFEELTLEPNPQQHIDEQVRYWQAISAGLVQKVAEITRALGINTKALPHLTGGRELAVAAGNREVKEYKSALVTAQKETLPKLFGEIKEANKMVAKWMAAPILPLAGQLDTAEETVTHIKRRIYAIELYAGVTEEIVEVAYGQPAGTDEKVHLFQRRLYMDEECLADYHAGGMDFKSIDQFERWLLKPANLDRLLPMRRCIVSMRVRRRDKERQTTSVFSFFINIDLDREDKRTFLYIRNGSNIYRLETDIDFSESLFPDRATFDPQRPMMAKFFGSNVKEIIDRAEFEALEAADKERERNSKQWLRDNPASTWDKKNGTREWSKSVSGTACSAGTDMNPSTHPASTTTILPRSSATRSPITIASR